MNLSIKYRILLLQLLPPTGSELEMLAIKDISDKVNFSDEEKEGFEMKFEGNNVQWDPKKETEKETVFTSVEAAILKTVRERLDKEKQITLELLPLMLEIKKL